MANESSVDNRLELIQQGLDSMSTLRHLVKESGFNTLTEDLALAQSLAFAHPNATERHIVDTMLCFHNPWLLRDSQQRHSAVDFRLSRGQVSPFEDEALPEPWVMDSDALREELVDEWNQTKKDRNSFRRRLDSMLGGKNILVTKQDKYVLENRVLVVADWSPETFRVVHHYLPSTVDSLCRLAIVELRNHKFYRPLLAKCKRADCGAYFFRKPTKGTKGGPPQKYCSPECTLTVNKRENAERVAARRAGMSLAEWRRRR